MEKKKNLENINMEELWSFGTDDEADKEADKE